MLKRTSLSTMAFASVVMLASMPATAGPMISAGTPTTSVPTALFDPLISLSSPLSAGQFLLPIEISGATGLQDWSFDLTFDATVANPLDLYGLYHSVYQAEFNGTDAVLSDITSSGTDLGGVLQTIAGFSSGVSGDGTLAYILFQYEQGQETNDPDFGIENPTVTQQVPEPATLALFTGGLIALLGSRRRLRSGELRSL